MLMAYMVSLLMMESSLSMQMSRLLRTEMITTHLEYPVFRLRRNQHRAAAVMTSVAMPSPRATVPMTFEDV